MEEVARLREEWRIRIEKAERELTLKFEKWLSKQSEERLRELIRELWEVPSLRLAFLPYDEILREETAKKKRK